MNALRHPVAALALLAPILVSPAPAPAPSYIPNNFAQMALVADLVVTGTIGQLSKDTFALSIDQVVAGELPKGVEDELVVGRFQNWTCAWRWTPYASGQRVALFLRRLKRTGGKSPYGIMSAGGEGEMPMTVRAETDADGETKTVTRVILRGRGLDGLDGKRHTLTDGSTVYGPEIEIDSVVSAITKYRKCFRATMNKERPWRIDTIERIAPDEQVTRLTTSSRVGEVLVRETGARFFW